MVVDDAGATVFAAGSPDSPFYPRSAVKPLQAAGMLRAGLDLAGSWLALASASHSGEPFHLAAVEAMLSSVGLDPDALQCPADWPLGVEAAEAYVAAGQTRARVAMNCSGKHAAMLMTCAQRGWPTSTYLAPEHPLQTLLRDTVEELAGPVTMTSTDGCGAPLWGISLTQLARAFVALPVTAPQVARAMTEYPEYVGGSTRDVTLLMRGVPTLVTKDGAEAVQALSVEVGGRRYGVALKIADGSDRARSVVAASALGWLGMENPVIADFVERPVLGGGRPVGAIRLASGVFSARM